MKVYPVFHQKGTDLMWKNDYCVKFYWLQFDLFIFFSFHKTVEKDWQVKEIWMGFKLWSSNVLSDFPYNCATTTALLKYNFEVQFKRIFRVWRDDRGIDNHRRYGPRPVSRRWRKWRLCHSGEIFARTSMANFIFYRLEALIINLLGLC